VEKAFVPWIIPLKAVPKAPQPVEDVDVDCASTTSGMSDSNMAAANMNKRWGFMSCPPGAM
jgi:hypothetical protein